MGIEFPIIVIAKDGVISRCNNYDDLSLTTSASLKSKYHENLVIIDVKQLKYIVDHANGKQYIKHKMILSRIKSIFFPKLIKIQLIIQEDSQVCAIDEIKELVINCIKQHKDFYIAGDNYEEVLLGVEKADTVRKIIDYLPNLFNWDDIH